MSVVGSAFPVFNLHPGAAAFISAKPAQPVKRPIQLGPKVSIQPKPMITAVPLAHAAAPLQAKTIIIQPLQTTVMPVVKPAPVSIQPAPPPGQRAHCTLCPSLHYTILHQSCALVIQAT